ncbi:MAG: alanine:cation symporter family protein [Gammaproteobacteria bacterium]|nr:alanine:cation symporter family protein [Gammaproteobacteria bacterium]
MPSPGTAAAQRPSAAPASGWPSVGVARGVFSNEARPRRAPPSPCRGAPGNPVRTGAIGLLGAFIDTIIVCTMTALVIVISGAWITGGAGGPLSAAALRRRATPRGATW